MAYNDGYAIIQAKAQCPIMDIEGGLSQYITWSSLLTITVSAGKDVKNYHILSIIEVLWILRGPF